MKSGTDNLSDSHSKKFEDLTKDIQAPAKGHAKGPFLERSIIEQLESKLTKESVLKHIKEEPGATEELEVKRERKIDQDRVKTERERRDKEKKEIRDKSNQRLEAKKRKRNDEDGEDEDNKVKMEKRELK